MFIKGWRRGRGTVLASVGLASAGLAGAGAVLALGAGLLGAGGVNAATTRPRAPAPHGSVLRAPVPWKSVGAGWVLAEYQASKSKPVTLDLVSPAGAKYVMHTWPASQDGLADGLYAWSPDKTKALFFDGYVDNVYGKVTQLNLQTGKLTSITFPRYTTPGGYTLPAGKDFLGVYNGGQNGTTATLGIYSATGKLVRRLASQSESVSAIQPASGSSFVVSAATGLRVISSGGKLLKNLPVPGVHSTNLAGCTPVRWWSGSEALATCYIKSGAGISYSHLVLVPTNGAKPKVLTPARTSGDDYGDLDAWPLSSGLYLQSAGACGQLEINKQAANGSITPVTVPGTPEGASYQVVTASGSSLLVNTLGCQNGGQLVWYNPGSKAEIWLFRSGAIRVVPFYIPLNG
jgi:hypothetical protein